MGSNIRQEPTSSIKPQPYFVTEYLLKEEISVPFLFLCRAPGLGKSRLFYYVWGNLGADLYRHLEALVYVYGECWYKNKAGL